MHIAYLNRSIWIIWINFNSLLELLLCFFFHPDIQITFSQIIVCYFVIWFHFDCAKLSRQTFDILVGLCECWGHFVIPDGFFLGMVVYRDSILSNSFSLLPQHMQRIPIMSIIITRQGRTQVDHFPESQCSLQIILLFKQHFICRFYHRLELIIRLFFLLFLRDGKLGLIFVFLFD